MLRSVFGCSLDQHLNNPSNKVKLDLTLFVKTQSSIHLMLTNRLSRPTRGLVVLTLVPALSSDNITISTSNYFLGCQREIRSVLICYAFKFLSGGEGDTSVENDGETKNIF